LDEAALPKALRTIALSAGAKVTVTADGSYLFDALDAVDPLPPPQAEAPTQRVELKSADLQWHTVPLHHAVASDILKLMRWNKPTAFAYSFEKFWPHTRLSAFGLTAPPLLGTSRPSNPYLLIHDLPVNPALPEGVSRIFAMERDNASLVEATKAGFEQMLQVVKMLDIAAHGMTATVSYLSVSEDEAGLKWGASLSPAALLQFISGPIAAEAFDTQVKSEQAPIAVQTLHESEGQKPLEWIVSDYRLTRPRLNSDDSLTLFIEPLNHSFPVTETAPIWQNGVSAIREAHKPDVIFIQIKHWP
jgi:hypothetical protein